ncbi:YbaB/EbfC family nucleoid-associated protein [Amycolatopsis sp.]|uniref:YbaB/EbfC family nucleoid-associated protein n=1 Tax=Amycolatopsis sp. TaxID=37632 RepID=UPI002BA80CEF|nr:YbaB/EbfC family nucleoid-associated protein [Amycolatopsis sp.]HVV11675.1 YbaB/EbfC family nucleoid-associated protein [Amycolatopsis sp.]
MNERRTAERLLADAEARVHVMEGLPERLAEVRGWAYNGDESVHVTVDVHGGLKDLKLAESALRLSPEEIGAQIVELSHRAQRAALAEGVNVLGDALGDAAALEMMRSAGLEADPEPEVIPYTPGVDPNAHRWHVIN